MLETNIVELHNLCKTKDEIIKKLKQDIEKLNETNMILKRKNLNLESELENQKNIKLTKNESNSDSLRIDRIDSNSNSISSNQCNSIESNNKVTSKLNRLNNQKKLNNTSDEYDECFELELTNTFNQNEIKCGISNYENKSTISNSSTNHSNTRQNNNSQPSNPSKQTYPQHSIPTEIETEQELDNVSTFEFNKTNDDINKSSIISCTSKDKFNN